MTRERRVYKPRLVGGKVMLAPHKYMLDIEHIDHISDEMRAVVENEWPELAHKLPPRAYFQRAFAAVLAISFRRLADIPSARAFPPLRPSATAAGSLPSSGVLRMTWTVLPIF